MRRLWRSGWSVLLLALVLMVAPVTASAAVGKADHTLVDYSTAASWPKGPETDAPGIFAMELNSGAVLYNKAGDERHYPASTTKIMTALLTLENCELDDLITFSHNAIFDLEPGGHHYDFQEGEVLSVDECLQFLLVESVNECAYAMAEHVAGSKSAFVDMMNAKAQELGAMDTHFNNPHGLNDENHYTTAHDMAMILWGCIQDPRFQQYADIQSISLKGREIKTSGFQDYLNHHEMVLYGNKNYDTDVVCGKTGFTSIAGSTLVTYGHRNDMDVIVVIMQGEDQLRFQDTKKVLDYAFDNFELVSVGELNKELLTGNGSGLDLEESMASEELLLLPKQRDPASLTSDFVPRGEDNTDTAVLGTRNWYYEGIPAGSSIVTLGQRTVSPYVTEEAEEGTKVSVGKPKHSSKKDEIFGLTKLEWVLIIGIGVVVLILIAIFLRIVYVNRERRRREMARRRREQRLDAARRDAARRQDRR